MERRGCFGTVLLALFLAVASLTVLLSAGCAQQSTPLDVSREQAMGRAADLAKSSRPEMGMIEARVDEVSAEQVTFKEAHTRRGGSPGPGAYPPGITDESLVWWVTVRGYFRYEGMPMPQAGGGHSRPIYEADRQQFVCYVETAECFASSTPSRLIATTPVPQPSPTATVVASTTPVGTPAVGEGSQGVPVGPTFPWMLYKSDEPFLKGHGTAGFVISWDDNSDNEDGFRLEVEFGPGGERYEFRAPANAATFAFPLGFDFGLGSPEECLRRRELAIRIYAFNAAGESPLAPGGQFVVQRECFDLPSSLPNAGGAPLPVAFLAVGGMALSAAGLAIRVRRGSAR